MKSFFQNLFLLFLLNEFETKSLLEAPFCGAYRKPGDIIRDLRCQIEELRSSRESLISLMDVIMGRFSKRKFPKDCAEALAQTRKSDIYAIQTDLYSEKPFLTFCDNDVKGGGWTMIQRRFDGSVDFFRDWTSYKIGFGAVDGEYFLGLDKIYALTTETPQELLIILTDFENTIKFARYDAFAIGDENEDYVLKVLGDFSGDAGDSFSTHRGCRFSTKDRKNDESDVNQNCACIYKGGWWYRACHDCNLNGLYLKPPFSESQKGQGLTWYTWHGQGHSLKATTMLIRPKKF